MKTRAFIGLGSNLDAPAARLERAFEDLELLPQTRLIATSPLYANPPFGPVAQDEFVNAVAMLDTELDARALLLELRRIETAHGRVRDGTRWGPRTLDLDILVFGALELDEPDLHLPHRGIPERNFVLYPLADLAPELVVPRYGALKELLARCSSEGLRRL